MKNALEIQIAPRPQKDDWYVAKYHSGFRSATYSVKFANSITGALASYHFVEMLKTRYPHGQVTAMLPTDASRSRTMPFPPTPRTALRRIRR